MRQFLFIIFTFVFGVVQGQTAIDKGFPFIRNFDEIDVSKSLQNWMTVQAPNGYIYAANASSLLEFDGVSWRSYNLPNKSAIRALEADTTGRIYIGGIREFGYFYPDEYSRMVYYSISDQLDTIDFESVWKVLKTSDGIYFVAGRKHIYKYANNKVALVTAPPVLKEFRASVVDNTIYFYDIFAGFGFVEKDTMRIFDKSLLPDDHTVYFLLPKKGQEIAVGVRERGIYLFYPDLDVLSWKHSLMLKPKSNRALKTIGDVHDCAVLHPVNSELNNYLKGNGLYFGVYGNDMYYFSTLRNGVLVTDSKFNVLNHYGKKAGILSNTIYHISIDKHGGCWFSGERGISYVQSETPFRFYNELNGIEGSVITVKTHKTSVYVGTTNGLYEINEGFIDIDKLHQAQLISDDFIFIMSFTEMDKYSPGLLVASLRDVLYFNVKTKKIKSIAKIYGSYDIEKVPFANDLYIVGTVNGLEMLRVEFEKDKLKKVTHIPFLSDFKESVRDLVFDNNNNLWISTAYNGVFKVNFKEDIFSVIITEYNRRKGLSDISGNRVFIVEDSIYVTTNKGIYQYLPVQDAFIPYNGFAEASMFDSTLVKTINVSNNGIWFATSNGLVYYDINLQRLETNGFNQLSGLSIENIEVDSNGNLWLSIFKNVVSVDTSLFGMSLGHYNISFRDVVIGIDSLLEVDCPKGDSQNCYLPQIPFSHNSLKLELACPAFYSLDNIQFSFEIPELKKGRSAWSKSSYINFSYLPWGDYVMKVYAKDVDNRIIAAKNLHFSVGKPIYLTFWAFVFYVIAAGAIVVIAIMLNSRRLKGVQNRLQRRISDAVSIVQQQKEELEQQASFLAETNKELEKLSIVAEFTDNAVAIMDGKGNYQWINKGFTRMYGYRFQELIHDENRSKIGRNSNLRVNDLINIWYGNKKPIIYEAYNKCKDGREVWVQTVLTPILDTKGNVNQLISIDTDISKLKGAERQIEAQRDEIKQQRDIALSQRDEIMQQQQEINDSISYTQKIQSALFPSKGLLDTIFQDNFIFDRPRNIVSGDFFWTHRSDEYSLLAVADCTGHGVPGAFMSLIGLNFLNDIVINGGVTKPDIVLNLLRSNIINALRQTDRIGDNKDGMDIALVAYDVKQQALHYAGANNAAIIRRGSELIELEPDKMPISIFRDISAPFTQKTIKIQTGDILYMYSDGYIDQFGGKNGKKFKTNNFKELLLRLPTESIDRQGVELMEQFDRWKGKLEQVDDVFVLGVRL